jgi:hypothetical protein
MIEEVKKWPKLPETEEEYWDRYLEFHPEDDPKSYYYIKYIKKEGEKCQKLE